MLFDAKPMKLLLQVWWNTGLRCSQLTKTVPTHSFPPSLKKAGVLNPELEIFREDIKTQYSISKSYSFVVIFCKIPWDKAKEMTLLIHMKLLYQVLMKPPADLDGGRSE